MSSNLGFITGFSYRNKLVLGIVLMALTLFIGNSYNIITRHSTDGGGHSINFRSNTDVSHYPQDTASDPKMDTYSEESSSHPDPDTYTEPPSRDSEDIDIHDQTSPNSFIFGQKQVSVGFCSKSNQFPYYDHFPDANEGMRKSALMFADPGQSVRVSQLSFQCNYEDRLEKTPVNFSKYDVFFGVGWFYHTSIKDRRRALINNKNTIPGRPDAWDDGLYWDSRLPRASRKNIDKKSSKYAPYLVAYSGEAFGVGKCLTYDVIIDAGGALDERKPRFQGCPVVFALSALRNFMSMKHYNTSALLRSPSAPRLPTRKFPKNNFAAFLVKNCYSDVYTAQAAIRPAFFDILSEYKPVMAIKGQNGKGCRTGIKSVHINRWNSSFLAWDMAVHTFQSYKFVITFENRQLKGYVTEKIMNALLAGVVPIYFGAPDIGKYINKKRFVHCDFNGDSVLRYPFSEGKKAAGLDPEPLVRWVKTKVGDKLKECAEKVKELDQNDDLYEAMINEPILPGNRLEGSEFDVRVVMRRINRAIRLHHDGTY
ncbi:hypothetical protein AAMO2058_001162200 [Amorphochlora amoebiformis]|mmetsp:Transcript_20777/g.32914  ORF Transcript_20777/g.32914 Transcript_20777/m.32914 type:complete len:538 (-) Transcript_20777:121-1734(-)